MAATAITFPADQTSPIVHCVVEYLRRDPKYDHEKPFFLDFDLDQTGFELVDLGDSHPADNFEDRGWLKSVYYPFVEELVLRNLCAKEVRVFEHQVSSDYLDFHTLPGRVHTDDNSSGIATRGSAGRTPGALSTTIRPSIKLMLLSQPGTRSMTDMHDMPTNVAIPQRRQPKPLAWHASRKLGRVIRQNW